MVYMVSHERVTAWRVSYLLTLAIYRLTSKFPPEERYGLISQMRRAAVSIPSNIAEGYHRGTRPEYKRFCYIANGSAAELHTQLRIAQDLQMAPLSDFVESCDLVDRVQRLTSRLSKSL